MKHDWEHRTAATSSCVKISTCRACGVEQVRYLIGDKWKLVETRAADRTLLRRPVPCVPRTA